MKSILETHIENKEFSHGYLLCGDADLAKKLAFEASSEILLSTKRDIDSGLNLQNHPDFYYGKFDSFGIGDSRAIKEWSSTKSFWGFGKVSVIEISSFTMEAANALLKMLEEPGGKIYYFIITHSQDNVIPTLKSRLVLVNIGDDNKKDENGLGLANEFYEKKISQRLTIIKKILADKDTAKEKTIEFLNDLEKTAESFLREKKEKQIIFYLKEILKARNNAFLKGASLKIILEHLALSLPIVKK